MESRFGLDPGHYKYEGKYAMAALCPTWAVDKAKQFQFKDSDVLCAAYCKCGKNSLSKKIVFRIISVYN